MSQNPPPLNVIITATDQTRQAVESAKNGFEGLKTSAGALQGILAGAAAALAGLTVVGKFNSFVEGAAALDDLAEKTGASVEKLSALAGVAKISGVSLDVVEGSLVRLAKGLAGADEESKGAGNALAALGLKAEELKKLDTADALKVVADRLNEYRDGAGKTALAIDLLGKSGAQALPYLKDLAETQNLQAKITAEQAAQAENLQKNLVRLSASTSGAWKEFSAAVLPVVDSFVQALLKAQNESGGLRDEIKKLAADGTIQTWAENAAVAIATMVDSIKLAVNTFNVLKESIGVIAAGAERLVTNLSTERNNTMSPTMKRILQERAARKEYEAEERTGEAVARLLREKSFADEVRAKFQIQRNIAAGIDAGADLGGVPGKKSLSGYSSLVDKAGAGAKDELKAIETYVAQIREQLVGATEGEFAKMRQKALDVFGQVDFSKLTGGDKDRFVAAFAEATEAIETLEERAMAAQWGKALAEQFNQAGQAAEAANAALANFNQGTSQQAQDLEFEISMVGKLSSERQKLAAVRRIELDAQRAAAAVPESAANRDETLATIATVAEQAKLRVNDLYDTLRTKGRDGFTGLQVASAEYFSRITDDAANFAQAFTGIMGSLENTFVTFAKTGKFEFKGLVDSIIADIARIVIRQQITAPLAKAVNGALGADGLAGLFGFGKSSYTGSYTGDPALDAAIGLRANGGPVSSGAPYIVGERGPELFVPGVSGQIIPNHAMGGVTIVQNINIDSRSDQASILQAMNVAKEQAKAEILESRQRGGAFA